MSDANTIGPRQGADVELMQAIREQFGGAIKEACAASSVPPSFLAALIANESGGKNQAQRFELSTFERLKEVLLGTKPEMHPAIARPGGPYYAPAGIKRPITKQDLLAYCAPGTVDAPRADFDVELQTLHNLATSWGLTQIMGWHLVEFQSGLGIAWLATPGGNLTFATAKLLPWFAEQYSLDLLSDFPELLRCWNTGEPAGKTFDPEYVPNGLARKAIYESL